MSVQIGLYKGKSRISKCIRFLTRSNYSHAVIYLSHDKNIHFIAEMWQSGLRMVGSFSACHTPKTEVDLFEINPRLSEKQEKKLKIENTEN